MKKKQGISLIVLIITIIVMLILAAATMITLIGDNGIITKAQEAAFREEMLAIRETVNLYNIVSQVNGETEISLAPLSISDIEGNKLKDTLKLEIAYWGNYEIEVNELTPAYVNSGDNFKTIVTKRSDNVKDIYYIQGDENINRKYIYNKATDVIYKVSPTRIGIHKVHSIEELDFRKAGGTREKVREAKNYTNISYATENVTVDGLKYYEPDLNNMAKEATSLIFYKVQKDGEDVTVTNDITEMSASEWLAGGRKNEIEVDGNTYVLYDYKNNIWANIKIVINDLETWWTWIPRYAYNENTATAENTQIIFVDINNNPLNDVTTEDEYTVVGEFKNNQKKGVWVSKYEPSPKTTTDTAYYEYYIPDLSGFDKERLYIQIYNKETGSFEKEVKASTITNLSQFAAKNLWFDYENQIWANVKVVINDLETWWVWIPRYAYNASGTTTETDVIFVDINNKPIDGSKLPSGYEVAGEFKNNQKKGIWVSKYEPTPTVVTQKQNISASNIDVTGFDKQKAEMVFYRLEDGKIVGETKTLSIEEWESKGRPTEITSWFTKYKLFDYKNNIWANVKVVINDLETWWVWIPRYAYNASGTTTETDVIFVDVNNKPIDGSKLPRGYEVAGEFKNNQKLGIWVSKYEPTPTEK